LVVGFTAEGAMKCKTDVIVSSPDDDALHANPSSRSIEGRKVPGYAELVKVELMRKAIHPLSEGPVTFLYRVIPYGFDRYGIVHDISQNIGEFE
jgi:hypothetical protein